MALKDTILGWLGRTPEKSDELEDAVIDAADTENAEQKAENIVQEPSGSVPGELEQDQEPPATSTQ